MKVYYDESKKNVYLESLGRLFPNTSLIAWLENDNVGIKYIDDQTTQMFFTYTEYQKQNGDQAGDTAQEVVDYLNGEFSKGSSSGEGTFSGLLGEVTINDININTNTNIIITPFSSLGLNDMLYIKSIFQGGFTVGRIVINITNSLTSNLKFKYFIH